MAKQTINIGSGPNTGTGEALRTAFTKVNENFTEVYDVAQAALDGANTLSGSVSTLQGVTISLNTDVTEAQNTANIAWDAANSASTLAQSAYDYANTIVSDTQVDPLARSIANSAFDAANAVATFDQDLNTTNNVSFSSVSTSLTVSDSSKLGKIVEIFSGIADATDVVTHDCTNNHIFYHTSIDSNFTANFTNLNLANNEATSLTIVLNQGVTAYIANTVQIEGNSQTIKWFANTEPTGNANGVDVMSFSVLNNSGTFIVLGQLSAFG